MKKRSFLLGLAFSCLSLLWAFPFPGHAGGIEVSTWDELRTALNQADHNYEVVLLARDIQAEAVADHHLVLGPEGPQVTTGLVVDGPCTLDLNGHTLSLRLSPGQGPATAGMVVGPEGTLTVANGSLFLMADYGIVNTGTLVLHDMSLEGKKIGLYDLSQAYTEIRSAEISGHDEAGYVNEAMTSYVDFAHFIGPIYAYKNGVLYGKRTFHNAQFSSTAYAIFTEGAGTVADLLGPSSVLTQVEGVVNPEVSSLQAQASIGLASPLDGLAINLFIGDPHLYVRDGQGFRGVVMDVAPYIKRETSRTMLPLRFLGEALGLRVDYESGTEKVTLENDCNTIILYLNSPEVMRNGGRFLLDTPPEVVDGRTMLPVGELADLMGMSRDHIESGGGYLEWDGNLQSVYIYYPHG